MNAASPSERIARRIVEWCAIVGAGASLLGIAARILGRWWTWMHVSRGYLGIALPTAFFLVLLSAALIVHSRWPQRAAGRRFGWVVVGVIGMACLTVFLRLGLPFHIEFERWLVVLLTFSTTSSPGHMSPHTAGTFLCVVGALSCLLTTGSVVRWRRRVGFALAVLAFGSSLFGALGFVIGTPLVYGGRFPSMTLLTTLIFVLLTAGLMLAAFPKNWLLQGLAGELTDAADAESSRFRHALAIMLVILAAGLASAGFYFLKKEHANLRARVEQELVTAADSTAARIADWRNERMKQANLLLYTPYVARRSLAFFADRKSPATRRMISSWLDSFLPTGPYEEALLLDPQLNIALISPDHPSEAMTPAELSAAKEAIRRIEVVMADLHRSNQNSDTIQLSFAVPLVGRWEGQRTNVRVGNSQSATNSPDRAVLLLRIDARKTLFPLMKIWTTPSRTAEVLLIRREPRGGIYLNELRYRTNAALQFRFALNEKESPAVLAALGKERILKGLDYRGASVIAVTRKVPNSPWSLLVKEDENEIYAKVRERGLVLGAMLIVFIIAVTMGINLLWRQRDVELLRRQVTTEHERFVLAQRLAQLMKHANDIVIITDDQWRIVDVNERALETYGYSLAEMKQKRAMELRPLAAQAEFAAAEDQFRASGQYVVETLHQRKDGSILPVEISARKIEIDGITHSLAIIRDITERKQAEQALRDSENRYRSLVETAQDTVFTMTVGGKFTSLNPAFETLTGWPREKWLGRSFRELVHTADLPKALEMVAWVASGKQSPVFEIRVRKQSGDFITAQILAAPQMRDGRVEELLGISRDVTAAKQMEESLRKSEERYRAVVESQTELICRFREDTTILFVNDVFCRFFGKTARELLGHPWKPNALAEDFSMIEAELRTLSASNPVVVVENRVRDAAGLVHWMQFVNHGLFDAQGRLTEIQSVGRDVTDRKRAEEEILALNESLERRVRERTMELETANEALGESEARLRLALEASDAGTWSWDVKSGVASWDERYKAQYGFGPEEPVSHEAWLERIHPEDRQRLQARIRTLMGDGTDSLWNEEFRVLHPGDHVRWMISVGRVERDSKGQAVRFAGINLDITKRKQVEEALRETEERFRTLATLAPAGIYLADKEGRFLFANPKWCEMAGMTLDEALGVGWIKAIHPEDCESVLAAWQRMVETQGNWGLEYRFRTSEGKVSWVYGLATPIRDSEARIAGYVGINTDITERKRTEEALKVSEARNRLIAERTFEGILIHENGRVVDCNHSFARMFGYEPSELVGMDALQFIAPGSRENVRNRIQSGSTDSYETVGLRKDGSMIDLEIQARELTNGNRKLRFASCRDVTERKRAEDALREQMEQIETIYGAAPVGLCLLDTNLRYVRINERLAQMNGVPAVDHLGRTICEVVPYIADEAEQICREVIASGQPKLNVEMSGKTEAQEDALRHWLVNWVPLKRSDGVVTGVSVVVEEITERKRAEESLRASEARFRALAEDMPHFVWETDAKGTPLYANQRFLRYAGLSFEQVQAGGWLTVQHPDDQPRVAQAWRNATENVSDYDLETRMRDAASGEYRWFRIKGGPVRDSTGCVGRWVGSCTDIHEARCATDALQQLNQTLDERVRQRTAQLEAANEELLSSEVRLQQTAEAGNVGLWDWDLATNRVFYSLEWKRQIGYEDHEISNDFNEWQIRVHPDDLEGTLQQVHAFLEKSSPKYEVEFRFRHKDGSYRWILAQASKLVGKDGKTQRMLGSHVDITERKHAEEEILSLSKFPAEDPNPVLRISKNGEILYANPGANSIIGGFADHGRLSDEWRQVAFAVFASGEKREVEREINHRTYSFIVAPVLQQHYVNIYGRDITELKQLQQQLLEVSDREQARIGQDLHDGLGQLLVSAAFDLNRLEKQLNGRAGATTALARQAGDTIDAAITQARNVARGLFAVQLGGDGLPQALRDLAASVTARFQIACKVHCPETVPIADHVSATHLFRIAQEAVNNAVKHARPRRIVIRLTVKAGRIDLTVADDGNGIASAQGRRDGMGLYIMDYRARALNGEFRIERAGTKGTRVSCSVPRHKV